MDNLLTFTYLIILYTDLAVFVEELKILHISK